MDIIDCPDRAEIEGLITGRLPPDRLAWLERHLDGCQTCRRAVEAVFDAGSIRPTGPRPKSPPPSVALQRVMVELQAGPPNPETNPRDSFPILQPTDRPGFLGRLGVYEIRREIGRGGMGVVFEGLDPALNRTVAIKLLSPLANDTVTRERFLREAQAVAALEHEHVVTIHAVDEVGGLPFLVMQCVVGESLADRLTRETRLAFAEVVRIGAQVARGLAAAHAKGLVHRDIKPGNILLESLTGRVKITDFGLAKLVGGGSLTKVGMVVGTPEFMSPEQATNGSGTPPVDARSDLFSLGVVLYLACSGASPFRAESPLLTLDRVRREQPTPLKELDPTLPDWFCAVVERLLRKDPTERVASASELADLLERTQSPVTLPTHVVTQRTLLLESAPRTHRRLGWAVPVVGFALVAAAVGVYFGWPKSPQIERPPDSQRPEGFTIVGRSQLYRDLTEAVTATGDGDVIEVNGNGPFPSAPVRTSGKRLTIRAVAPSHPVFITDVKAGRAKQPFLTADADLTLEGLELHWDLEGNTGWFEAEQLARAAIVSTAGRLTLRHCRVVTSRADICVGASRGEVVLLHSHLVTGDLGFCVYWRPSGGALRAEQCQFEGRVAMSVSTVADKLTPNPAPLHLERNTIATEKALNLQLDSGPRQSLRITARGNLFNSSQQVVLFAVRNLGKNEVPRPEDMTALARLLTEWTDEDNVYRRGNQYLVVGAVKQAGKTIPAGIDSLAQWQQLWKKPASRSVEGTIRFAERRSRSAPLQLLSVDDPSGEVPPAGANPDQLGPN